MTFVGLCILAIVGVIILSVLEDISRTLCAILLTLQEKK